MRESFNGFPIDGTAGTQIKYDMFAKHMGSAMGFTNRFATNDYSQALGIFGLIIQLICLAIGLSLSLIIGIIWLIGFLIKTILINLFALLKK